MSETETRTLECWDPFGGIARWPFGDELWPARPGDLSASGRAFAPAVDVSENDKRYLLTMELPGAKKKDVTVEFDNGMLTIRGEKRSKKVEKGEHRRHVERSFGSFSRSFSLPANADRERIKARFKKGVLKVKIRKKAGKPARKIDVAV